MSHISFYMKSLGQRSAGKPHAALDVAGAGNVLLCSGAPVLDPTCESLGVRFPRATHQLEKYGGLIFCRNPNHPELRTALGM